MHQRPVDAACEAGEVAVIVGLLRDLIDEVRALRVVLAQRHAPAELTRGERAQLAKLLPAIAGAVGAALFVARELIDHPAVRAAAPGISPKKLGRLLSKADGVVIGALIV